MSPARHHHLNKEPFLQGENRLDGPHSQAVVDGLGYVQMSRGHCLHRATFSDASRIIRNQLVKTQNRFMGVNVDGRQISVDCDDPLQVHF